MAESKFDLCALVAACRDLATRSATLISTIYEKGDLSVIEKMYGENRKLTAFKDILNVKDPTTKADEMAQKLIIGSLQKKFPSLKVCGEEGDLKCTDSDIVDPNIDYDDMKTPDQYKNIDIADLVVWVDPVDGTKEFTEGIKSAVTTLIGIAYKGRPIAGVIARPFTKEIIWGIVGFGAFGFKNKDKLSTRDTSSRIICTSRSHFKSSMKAYVSACKPSGFVRAGGSGGKVLMVLEGAADAYVFPSLGTKKWDTCGPEAILLALGGKLTKPDGSLYDYDPLNVAAMNKEGFIATVFGDDYHATFLENNLSIFQLDLVLFGATGFTGKMAVEYLVDAYIYRNRNVSEEDGAERAREKKLNFGIAGRNKVKLQNVLYEIKSMGKYNGICDEIDARICIIECDCFDVQSVEAMVQKTSVIVSTVGPFAIYAENVIVACCKYGVDYVDLTGEFDWVKRMICKYDADAKRSSARIVNFGGCVAALTDCAIYSGVELLKKEETVSCISCIKPGCTISGHGGSSGGTVASWLHSVESGAYKYDPHNAYFLCDNDDYKWQSIHKQPSYAIIEAKYNSDLKLYGVPFIYGPIERMIFCRSNELLNYYYGENVKIYENLMYVSSQIFAWIFSLLTFIVPYLLKFSLFRSCFVALVRRMAYKQGKGPSISKLKNAKWREHIYIYGKNKDKNKNDVICEVDIKIFGDYGYLNTAKLLIEQGIICSLQRNNAKIRKIKGGFLTPAACFKNSLPKRLDSRLKEFEISYKIIKD